jgi:RHS repeat-associated protein
MKPTSSLGAGCLEDQECVFRLSRGSRVGQGDQLEQVGDPRGITLGFEYDNLGRPTRRYQAGPPIADDQTFSYDQSGNMLSANVVATSTAITMDYDQDGRLQKVYQASGSPTTTYTYNATTGRLSSIADPAGTTAFSLYDANGLLKEITDPFSATKVVYTYDTEGRVTKRTDGGKLCLTQTYEALTGRLDTRTIRGGATPCSGSIHASFNLDYDLASNVTRRVETLTGNTFAGTYDYTYDEANRLKTVAGPAAFGSRTYDYDGGGNRTSVQVNANPPLTTIYNAASLPVSSSDGTTYSHDQVGDLTAIDRSGGTNDWFFSYSSWNQLTKAERSPGSADVTYTLDALDRVLSRASTGATSQYTYQGSGEVLAQSVVGGSATTYAHTPGGPLAQKIGSTTRYYLRDLHGDLVGWSDTNGALQGSALYDPWGVTLSATGDMAVVPTNGAFRFQSDLADAATGQVDMGARLYEPVLGRFSSRDLLFGDMTAPASMNQYSYGGDNPVTSSDPTGLCAIADCPPFTGTGKGGLSVLPASSSWSSLEGATNAAVWAADAAPQLPRPKVVSLIQQILQTVIVRTLPIVIPTNSEDDGACSGFLGCVGHGLFVGARFVRNAPATAIGAVYATATGADCNWEVELTVACYGTTEWADGPEGGFTFGNTFITTGTEAEFARNAIRQGTTADRVLAHERDHSSDYMILGPVVMPVSYGIDYAVHGGDFCRMWFERRAGLADGGYQC